MKLHIFTIVLDGMPFITWHLPIFNRLQCDWHWTIAEGAAANVNCTKWCQPQNPRLSQDGTTEYLNSLKGHPRITVIQKQRWAYGKVEMCNACLPKEECALLQVDSDEIWTADQIDHIVRVYEANKGVAAMQFYCRYFLGWNIVATGDNCYGNRGGEWMRSWRFFPGNKWRSHEPPVFEGLPIPALSRENTLALGLVFDHYAYATVKQVFFKEHFYGYDHAFDHWMRLQQNTRWPVEDLMRFLPWVGGNAQADLLHK